MIIAVDGPAASGKGTLARRLARRLGFAYLDTGRLYRGVGMAVVRAGGDPSDPADAVAAAQALDPAHLDDPALKSDAAAQAASQVAALPEVRAVLLAFQRSFAARPPGGETGAVLDGRDIGTVVCPDADAKLFVTAEVEVRAKRRFLEFSAERAAGDGAGGELSDADEASIYARVLQDLRERDARDSGRSVAPLKPADDALVLDTSDLDADQAFEQALKLLRPTLETRAG